MVTLEGVTGSLERYAGDLSLGSVGVLGTVKGGEERDWGEAVGLDAEGGRVPRHHGAGVGWGWGGGRATSLRFGGMSSGNQPHAWLKGIREIPATAAVASTVPSDPARGPR